MAFHNIALEAEVSDNIAWTKENGLWSYGIEGVVRPNIPRIRAPSGNPLGPELPRLERPVRRRLRAEEIGVKSHQTFTMTTKPTMELRTGLDPSEFSSTCSPVTVVTTATSSAGTPWSSTERVEEIFDDEGAYNWREAEYYHQGDDIVVPKMEPSEELDMDDLYEVEGTSPVDTPSTTTSPIEVPIKRGRGRPRKHPKPDPEAMAKIHKGRSKTGCGTCRRRKKKCDEAKPICDNCKKNNVECVGYRPLQHWKSGKEKKEEEERNRRRSVQDAKRRDSMVEVRSYAMPSLFPWVDNVLDRIFFKHYNDRLSVIYTVEDEWESSFKRIVLPYALTDKGLMHSLLSLASRHIDYASSYGRQILLDHPEVTGSELQRRSQFHREEAQKELQARKMDTSIPAIHLQLVCLILETLNEENPKGDHRLHLKYSQALPTTNNPELQAFLDDFYRYHILADLIISLPQPGHTYHNFHAEWNLPNTILQKGAMPLLGVSDTLLLYMSRITNLRNQIRASLKAGNDPIIGFPAIVEASDIEDGIRSWAPVWPAGDYRDPAGQVYKCMISVYLLRTMRAPRRNEGWKVDSHITDAVNQGIEYLTSVDPRSKLQTVLLAPTFVIGCAAFEPKQRDKIRKVISVVKAYMGYRNTDTALKVLEEVWRLMDLKDERSWDWQTIAHEMGMDFLAT